MAYYRKALELDPDNETYKSNLKVAELRLREAPSPVSPLGQRLGAGQLGWRARPDLGVETLWCWGLVLCSAGSCPERRGRSQKQKGACHPGKPHLGVGTRACQWFPGEASALRASRLRVASVNDLR